MSRWKVVYTEHAEHDLRHIYEYIAYSLLEIETAKKQTQRIMNAINKLDENPLRFKLYHKDPWNSKGLRVLPVDNYLVFYLPLQDENSVVVIRIMYGGRQIEDFL